MTLSAEPHRPVPHRAVEVPTEAPPDDTSIGQLASHLSEQMTRLVRDELALAQTEAKQRAKRMGLGIGMFGAGGLLGFFGACCAVAAGVLGLANVLAGWLSALIIAAGLFVLAGLVVLPGKKNLQKGTPPVPSDAVDSVKADAAAVREAVKR